MGKNLLTTFVILLFAAAPAFASSAKGRVKMTVVRTNVQPADVNVVKNTTHSSVEIVY